jgi:hypothetical protein
MGLCLRLKRELAQEGVEGEGRGGERDGEPNIAWKYEGRYRLGEGLALVIRAPKCLVESDDALLQET